MAKRKLKSVLTNNDKKEPIEKTVKLLQETVKMLLDKVEMLEGTLEDCKLKIKAQNEKTSVKIDDTERNLEGFKFVILNCKKCDATFKSMKELKLHINHEHPSCFKCKVCDNSFNKRCSLEVHMKTHDLEKEFKCELCDKEFFLGWRLRRHVNGHDNVKKFCHFYNNQNECPYEELGCKFEHQISPDCKFKENCTFRLCQFAHRIKDEKTDDTITSDDSFDVDSVCDVVIKQGGDEFSAEENEILSDSFLDDLMLKIGVKADKVDLIHE